MKRCGRCAAAFVLPCRLGAGLRLRHVLDGQNAVADAQTLKPQLHQAARAVVADRIIMGGLAANDAAKGHKPVVL